jgi:histidine ammonia-lyase
MSDTYHISSKKISFEDITGIISGKKRLALSPEAAESIQRCRDFIDLKIQDSGEPVYGVNTGFGSLCNTRISQNDLETLQTNLVMSHACGTGEEVPAEVVRLMLLLKAAGLSHGKSGVQVETVQRLLDFYNNDITPVVYQQGSLGASGDLAPLAHLCLPLIGLGEVYWQGKIHPASEVMAKFGWEPVRLRSKEGLALLNGTQFMSAYGVHVLLQAQRLSLLADIIGALSLEAFDGRPEPFHLLVHHARPHPGQVRTAQKFNELLAGSELIARKKSHVQDPYSFRCIPQVHGATKDALDYVSSVFLTEINSVTDNPTVFPDEEMIISAGNFHGQPLALALDFLAIALSELANISERRTYQLISGARDLPPFLVSNPGLNSGFMIPQYTAASIVSQNKQLCTPASVDSIVSSNGQEDHVSMGANSATKAFKVADNVLKVLSIELLNAVQALEFRRPLKSSAFLEHFAAEYRREVSSMQKDRVLYEDIQASIRFLNKVTL